MTTVLAIDLNCAVPENIHTLSTVDAFVLDPPPPLHAPEISILRDDSVKPPIPVLVGYLLERIFPSTMLFHDKVRNKSFYLW